MTVLMDTVRIQAPKRSPVRPVSPLDPSWDNAPETRSSERWSEVESPTRYHAPTQWDRLAMGRGALFVGKAA
jgi:hypothetical protein